VARAHWEWQPVTRRRYSDLRNAFSVAIACADPQRFIEARERLRHQTSATAFGDTTLASHHGERGMIDCISGPLTPAQDRDAVNDALCYSHFCRGGGVLRRPHAEAAGPSQVASLSS
jgi:hypothetical protein